MRRLRGIFPAICLLLACASAQAQLSLSVDVGWDGHYRIGRWAPLFLTLSDTTARPVIVEVRSPHSRGFGMHTRVALSVSPTPATYPLYLPLLQSLDGLLVTVRDARTERRLAQWPELGERSAMVPTRGESVDVLVGTSGGAPTLRRIEGQTRSGQVQTVFVPPLKLPVHRAGYDAFNLLVLNQPDLNQLNPEQQQAIADWVRSGGSLLMWPGPDPLPPASPLVAALPCTIGENVTLQIDIALLENFGLAPRFANLRGRELFPKPGAERVATFGAGGPDAWRWRYGFGQVLVLPMDPSFFVFRDDKTARAFWHPLLAGAIDVRAPDETNTARYYYWNDPALQRRSAAFDRAADLLGDVPGVGQFGFTYVAGVLIALMFIVGPIDWFVLKYLGKQPWTWVTTSGWIALVTVGALFVGNLFKSGDLHFRTLRIIDQADNQTVAATDLVCIYAPRTRFYEITVDREGWWQPGGDTRFGRAGAMTTDVPFGQDALSNRPAPMLINVWNLRFLQGETIINAPPMIDAQLALELDEANDWHLLGTITNRSRHVLRDIKVRSERPGGSTPDASNFRYSTTENLKQLQPGATARVRLRVAAHQLTSSDDAARALAFAGDLETDRSSAINQLLAQRDDLVCIYAEVEAPQPAVSIKSDEALQQHWQILRALVPIATGEKQ